jgi:hypothetical protein
LIFVAGCNACCNPPLIGRIADPLDRVAEHPSHPLRGVLGKRRLHAPVPLGDPDVGVTQDLLHHRERDPVLEREGRHAVPGGVDADVREPASTRMSVRCFEFTRSPAWL